MHRVDLGVSVLVFWALPERGGRLARGTARDAPGFCAVAVGVLRAGAQFARVDIAEVRSFPRRCAKGGMAREFLCYAREEDGRSGRGRDMLLELRAENYTVIDRAEVQFWAGAESTDRRDGCGKVDSD